MDPNLAYWTWSLVNLALVVGLGLAGVREIRAGRAAAHRRRMLAAGGLVVLFLVSYLFKVALLGREDRSLWSGGALATLYVHELCVAVMLVAASVALLRARRFGPVVDGALPAAARAGDRAVHRRAGAVALTAGALALLTAVGVLVGMYQRAGL